MAIGGGLRSPWVAEVEGGGARVLVTVVGEARVRPPFADDVAHYSRLLSRYVKLELVEVRAAKAVAGRIPQGVFVSLLATEGVAYDSVAFSLFLEERRQAGGDVAFVVGGPFGAPPLAAGGPPPLAGRDDPAPPARVGGFARAALPRA